jgi:hypothetical protein
MYLVLINNKININFNYNMVLLLYSFTKYKVQLNEKVQNLVNLIK